MYDGVCAQMDGGAQRSVTNNIDLLIDVRWYDRKFRPRHTIKGATSGAAIVPKAEGYLQVPTIQEGKFAKVKCYYSPKFTSTLLSDNNVLESLPY